MCMFNKVSNSFDKLKAFYNYFSDLFTNKFVEIKCLKAELYPEKVATPVFYNDRTVTYTLQAAVEGIINPVTCSKRGTRTKQVYEPNWKFRLCGDVLCKVK